MFKNLNSKIKLQIPPVLTDIIKKYTTIHTENNDSTFNTKTLEYQETIKSN